MIRINYRIVISLVFFSLLLTAGLKGAGSGPDSLVAAGNRYYMQKQYDQAVNCYTRVVQMGYSASPLYFNLGNAYYKLNNMPMAILYYEKARLLNPGDEDIRQNLRIANARIVDKIETIPDFFLKRWLYALTGMFSPDHWAMMSLILFAVSLAFFFIYMTGRGYRMRKTGFIAGVITLMLSLGGIMLMDNRKSGITKSNGAIIMSPVVNVKSSPDLQGTSVFVLHEGTRVMVTDSVLQWKEVKIPDGNKGWIQNHDLAEI
jgi:hypothetical protein